MFWRESGGKEKNDFEVQYLMYEKAFRPHLLFIPTRVPPTSTQKYYILFHKNNGKLSTKEDV